MAPLRKVVDEDQWEAEEDLVGRLGIVAHAAFLRAGFVQYGDEPSSGPLLKQVDATGPSAPRFSRRYTAVQLAARGEAVDSAVLELRARGNGDVAFQAYLLTSDGGRRRLSCEAVLDEASLAPLFSCSLDDAARALETGSAGAWVWKSLADWVGPALFLELCRWNDLPVTGFASLPDDAKAEILKRLSDGKDLARVECVSSQLRRLVAERDGELWKAMHESLGMQPEAQSSDSESESSGSWKERYMKARRRSLRRLGLSAWLFDPYGEKQWWPDWHRVLEADLQQRLSELDSRLLWEADYLSNVPITAPMVSTGRLRRHPFRRVFQFQSPIRRVDPSIIALSESTDFDFLPFRVPEDPQALTPDKEVVARGQNSARRHRKDQRNNYQKKQHGAGAIHSPSSRYKWKHR